MRLLLPAAVGDATVVHDVCTLFAVELDPYLRSSMGMRTRVSASQHERAAGMQIAWAVCDVTVPARNP